MKYLLAMVLCLFSVFGMVEGQQPQLKPLYTDYVQTIEMTPGGSKTFNVRWLEGKKWQSAMVLGAEAEMFFNDKRVTYQELMQKLTDSPTSVSALMYPKMERYGAILRIEFKTKTPPKNKEK